MVYLLQTSVSLPTVRRGRAGCFSVYHAEVDMMRAVSISLLAGLSLAAACVGGPENVCPQGGEPGLLVIHSGRLFDGLDGPVVADAAVVVRGNRITAAGPRNAVEIPRCAREIDAAGGTILPGFIDNHVHLRTHLGRGEDILTPWLRAGVTTLVDTGTTREGVARLRELARTVSPEPPRLYVAGPILTAPGGYPATRQETGVSEIAQGLRDAAEARAVVARLVEDEGADLIKVAVERGFFADLADPDGWPVPGPEILAAIAEVAHAHGKKVRAHVTQPGELAAILDAGYDATAHTPIIELSEPLLARAARQGVIFTTTVNIWGDDPGSPLTGAVQKNLARYVRLGGRVALGTDGPIFQPGAVMPMGEIRLLAAAGLTPREILLAATRHGGEALGLERELGTIGPGKLADVIVVDGDPLADLSALERVRVVIRDGEVIVPVPPG
jgi:imidazolonepropionase-like amidohydrolase